MASHPSSSYPQVDAMKLGVKEMKKEYKKVDISKIEVSVFSYTMYVGTYFMPYVCMYVLCHMYICMYVCLWTHL